MKLILDFDGRPLNPSNMLEALSKAGKNTTISISNAQALNIDTLLKATTTAENTAVAGAECNTVIELKLEHHAA
ncbi:hypothetical protein [Pseudomonas aeruginosa]|uniref:hypothetical protein n=1 Tax=Pseudomonas aeruginosa TaxID=287 RepID=UPI000B48BA26|nr:hypothetical protein [Pseudomonas aeruginosa]OWJ20919.1 hypothetical protein CDC04_09605 [Pseudomonas aeruginosa]